ncbi:YfcE family phosphodiesterase [Halobacteriales archaeon QS_1_68_20]|nr:MAG: YfcE family phosphodiesterase [Halobacteriales archaeon QS_1_68_20]
MDRKNPNYTVVFGDIHGNITALEAVFENMADHGFNSDLYCLGDLVGYGTYPNEVVEFVRSRSIPTVMGNYDRGVGDNSDDCGCAYQSETEQRRANKSIAWTNKMITEGNRDYLRTLERQIELELGDLRILLVHGSPRRINEYLHEDRPDSSFERLLDSVDIDVLVCGHTHLPYHKELPSGRHVINAGSVGKPKDGDSRACYIVLTADGDDLNVEFHRVEYDIEHIVRSIEDTEMPDAFAEMLRTGTS